MMGTMAVDEAYKDRLCEWISAEAAKYAENPGDKGVNRFSSYTERVLARWGIKGLSTTVISKWLNKQISAEVKSANLTRIGLLKGLSDDPKEAERLAYLWLSGQPVHTQGDQPNQVAAASALADQIANDASLNPADLHAIVVAAVGRLMELASAVQDLQGDKEEEEQPMNTPLTYLLQGWLSKNQKTPEDLATFLGVSLDRVERIIEGYPLTASECRNMADLLNLDLDTLVAWGSCPTLQQVKS